MLKNIIEKLKSLKDEKNDQKKLSDLFMKNHDFLKTIQNTEIENFFHYLVNSYSSNIVNIKFNKQTVHIMEINDFFNDFFSKYSYISIGESNNVTIDFSILKNSILNKDFEDVFIIGQDETADIFIKKNSKKNGIYINEFDNQEDIDQEDSLYDNIYYYLIRSIFSYKELSLRDIYSEFKNKK